MLEGGYNLDAISRCAQIHCDELLVGYTPYYEEQDQVVANGHKGDEVAALQKTLKDMGI